MKFQYTGVTRTRQRVKGVIDASDMHEAQMRLRAQQIRAEQVIPIKNRKQLKITFDIGSTISLKALLIFTRQFSSLIDSGVAIVQSLAILSEQETKPKFKAVLDQVKEDIEGGGGLAESLAKHPRVFSPFYVRVVEAGEISGTLDQSLRRINVQLEKVGRLRAKVIGALTYPCITIVVAMGALIILLTKVFPEIAKMYGDKPLPEITMMVLWLSNFVQANILYLMSGAFLGFIGVAFAIQQEKVRKAIDPVVVRMPIFGPLVLRAGIAKFTRTLSALVASGVPLLTAFDICAKIAGNWAIRDAIDRAASAVSEGRGIASGLSENKIFPPMVIHMVGIGEISGRLDDLLGKVADIYDDEVDDAVGLMTDLLQPMLIVGVGGIVLVLLLAMYMPIFSLGEAVSGL